MSPHLTWPAERFYWALIPGAPWNGVGELPVGLLALAEDDLPMPVESLHAVGVPTADGVLVCAAARSDLEELVGSVLILRPAAAPAGLMADCSRLNLMIGPFEPASIRRARLRGHATGAGLLFLLLFLIAMGLNRRSHHLSERAAFNAAASLAVARDILPQTTARTMILDLSRRASLAEQAESIAPPVDAAIILASLLERWPEDAPSRPQAITIRGREVSVAVTVQDAPAFLAAFSPPTGWTMHQPMLSTSGELTRLNLTLHAPGEGDQLAAGRSDP